MGISLWESISLNSESYVKNAFKGIKTAQDWKKARPKIYRQYMHSMGLDPLPERCELNVTDCGNLKGKGFTARKVAYQIAQDCWGAGVIYYPDPMPKKKVPGILYVCGHDVQGSYGYQYHAIMWARRGYICFIIDSIEQNDNPGEHCGISLNHYKNWHSMGYTPAGAEVYNGIRGLDVLEKEELVDNEKLAVTGVSGGGACSFHLAIADERVKAVSTLCGISSPYDAIVNRHMIGHCDCMYPINIYKRDISEYAALIAPRAVQFCSAQHDPLFHKKEFKALAVRTKYIYKLLGKEKCWNLVEDDGPHGDHPKFDEETCKWMDKHVLGKKLPLIKRGKREIAEHDAAVFNGITPTPNRLELLPQMFCKYGEVELPKNAEEWPAIRKSAVNKLKKEVPGFSTLKEERKYKIECSDDWRYYGNIGNNAVCNSIHKGNIDGIDVWMSMYNPEKAMKKVVLSVGSEGEYSQISMGKIICSAGNKKINIAGFEPRIGGANLPLESLNTYPAGSRMPDMRKLFVRAMQFTGTTPVMETFKDIGVALNYLQKFDATKNCDIYVYGRAESGVAALYRTILDERIKGVIIEDAPGTHRDGGTILGILKAFDIHQAIGLVAPRKVSLITHGHKRCMWSKRLYTRIGCPEKFNLAADLRQAMSFMLE